MSVRTTYDTFQDALRDASRYWKMHFVLPYSSAYNSAYQSFEDIIKAQKEADKAALERKMQLAMFALSFCGGSIFTHVFGSAVLKEVAAKVAVDTIINRGMERSFRAAAYIERNKTAQFMLGELWGKGEGWVGDKIKDGVDKKVTKDQLEENNQNYTALSEFASHPMNMQNNLEQWLLKLEYISSKVGEMIADISNEETVKKPLDMLMSSYFFTAAPKESIQQKPVSEEIELTFYMKFILDLDYVRDFATDEERRKAGRQFLSIVERPITQSALGVDYPMAPKDELTPYVRGNVLEVGYRNAGDVIRGRINQLYKATFGSDFFEKNEKISRKTLARAEITLYRLEELNHSKILKTLTKIK
ncbi:MAG: hypothetical protein V7849_02385 [Candidatus Competibacter sp.]|jgi:hypothetical protein